MPGSVRRAEPTVGDIDIVCTSAEPAAVIARFVAWERAEAVLAEGATKASIWLAGGLQIDLRVLPEDVFGNLLQHFTGSREHNIQLRELAVRKGLRVSENGILDVATGSNLTCRTEAEVYAALGLADIPPEMRLGLGEIEAAANGTLPVPVALADLRGDFHMHCTWSDGAELARGDDRGGGGARLRLPLDLRPFVGAGTAGARSERPAHATRERARASGTSTASARCAARKSISCRTARSITSRRCSRSSIS